MTFKAVVYKPAKSAMQSGKNNSKNWLLEVDNQGGRYIDSLMGWTGSINTATQIKLKFPTMEDALRYVKKNYTDYEVRLPNSHLITPKNYADNFLD